MDLTRDVDKERAMMNPKVAQMIKELSTLKYGIPKDVVEAEMSIRAKL